MNNLGKKILSVLAAGALGMTAQAQVTNVDVIVNAATSAFPLEMSWEFTDGASVLASEACGTNSGVITTVNLNLNDGTTYTFNAFDDWGDGWNGGSWSIVRTSDGAVLGSGLANNGLSGDLTDICDASQLEESFSFAPGAGIPGCTDPTAINYNPAATVDDGSCVFPAANDLCQNAINIAVGTCYTGSNVGATFNGDTLPVACVDGDVTPNDIWFTSTVPASGTITVEFPIVPGFSSIVELYESATCGVDIGILSSIGFCNNYSSGGGFTLSGLTPGADLLIRYWDYNSDQEGPLVLCLSEPPSGCTDPCASNFDSTATIDDGSCILPAADADDCASAAMISAGTTPIVTIGNTGSDITSCAFGDSVSSWYAYMVPAGVDSIDIYTCGSSFDTGLSLWDACGGSEIACNDDGTPGLPFGSTCGGSSFQSYIQLSGSTLASLAGSVIYIRIAGFSGNEGCGDLIIDEYSTACNSALTPGNQSHVNLASRVELSWDPQPAAVACQVQGKRLPTGPQPSVNILSAPINTTNVPYAVAGAGTTWTWRVRCACSISPLDVSAFSAYGDTFSIPVAREGDVVSMEDMVFPNPADNEVMVAYNSAEGAANVSFTMVDLLGRTVDARVLDLSAGLTTVRFDVSALEDGIYFVNILEGDAKTTHQITVAH